MAEPVGLPADWLPRLRAALASAPEHDPSTWRMSGRTLGSFGLDPAAWPANPRPAAVLVPIVNRPGAPAVLFTTRSEHLRHHAGQISFPGGRVESSDADIVAAAVRETREEIGIAPEYIEPLGFLPDHVVPSGFRITPVVALLQPDFTLRIDASEVVETFEIPLDYLSRTEHFLPTRRVVLGVEVTLHDVQYEGRVVWGATAGMLKMIHDLLAPPASP